ncbi:MAG: hypothetical protein NTV51_11495 [Verrucomicrobia bacterium]|nr:hypothetical protein [Verrucomicrobiota bacterium]
MLGILWLPATLRCEIGQILPEAAFFGCASPCNDMSDKGCTDSCAVFETGMIKISSDDVKAPPPSEALLCACLICLRGDFVEPDPASELMPGRDDHGDEFQRTWHLVQRAAPLSRAPSV